MEEKTINKTVRMNEIRKEISWIASEYVRMFTTDPRDLDLITSNDRFLCSVLSNQLTNLKEEIKDNKYPITLIDKLIITKLSIKLIKAEKRDMHILNEAEKKYFTDSFGKTDAIKMD